MKTALAISNIKNGNTHYPVAPLNPNKALFVGSNITPDQYRDIVGRRKSTE